MSRLYLTMGAPGAGKSTFIKEHIGSGADLWVSRDKVRFEMVDEDDSYFSKEKQVFKEFIKRVERGLLCGYTVWADATHLNKASRNKILTAIDPNIKIKDGIYLVYIKTPLEVAVEQNENRVGTRSFVPPHVITNMYYKLEEPELEEGFDRIYIVEPNKPIAIKEEM